jgi:hypothetical protein
LRIERRPECTLVIGPAAPGASATTIWSFIFIRPEAVADERLLRHELEHVRQWRKHGIGGFLIRYLRPYIRWRLRGYPHWAAYRRIPFEVEAEWLARRPEGA